MYKIVLTNPTGFKVLNPQVPVIIRDFRHILFYTTEPMVPKVKEFNLPVGTWYIEMGSIKPMASMVKYKLAKLPALKRRYPSPKDFRIEFAPNINKCSIFWNLKKIVFDTSFLEKPLYEIYFVLYHEFAHCYFKSETLADQLAGNFMKVRGYNPSQIGRAILQSLSGRQEKRKVNLYNSLITAHGKPSKRL